MDKGIRLTLEPTVLSSELIQGRCPRRVRVTHSPLERSMDIKMQSSECSVRSPRSNIIEKSFLVTSDALAKRSAVVGKSSGSRRTLSYQLMANSSLRVCRGWILQYTSIITGSASWCSSVANSNTGRTKYLY